MAKSMTPLSFGNFKEFGAGRSLFNGRKVTRPEFVDFKISIALFAT